MRLKVLEYALRVLIWYCERHGTCDGCLFRRKHIGCYFRGKTPREWKLEEMADSSMTE